MPKIIKLIGVLLCACVGLWAQSTAQIQGIVRDPSGSAIPAAELKVTQTDTGAVRTVTSAADGAYVLANLPIGPYRMEVSKAGFTTYVQTGIILQVASNPTIDVALKVGEVTEQVQVEANAALVDTERTGIGTVIENQRILELPLNGRNVVDLIQLAGAAIPAGQGSTGASIPGAQAISVAGGQTSGVAYWLDGANYTNPYDATSMPFPFPDALQEFKVETSALTAQNGVHSGASINAVTKSGTNNFHGDAFEFLRNGDLNARNFFAASRDTLKRNQFGGTLGGPIIKNKLFFFVGYQGTRTRQDASDSTAFVPTAQMLAGNWSAFASPTCNGGVALKLPTPFVNNQILPSLYSKAALAVTKDLPTTNDPCGRLIFGPRTVSNLYQVLGRVDYQLNEKHTLFARYMNTAYFQPPPDSLPGGNPLDTTIGGHDQLATSVTAGDTYLISSTMVNSFRASYNRSAGHTIDGPFFSGCDVGVNMYCFLPHQTVLSVTGGFTVGSALAANASITPTTYQIGDDVSIVRGAHQFAFGITAYQYRSSVVGNVYAQGNFSFNGTVTGNGMADFLLGDLASLTQGANNTGFTRKNYVGAYAQDTWKITRRLTLNIGTRWEPFIPEQVTNGAIYNFSLPAFYQGLKTTQFVNAPPGFSYPGDPGFPGNSGLNHRWNLWAPRVGLAWDPTGDGKTSIRASYGLSYDFVNAQFFANTSSASPWGNLTRVPGPVSFDNPWATFPGGNIFPYAFGPNVPFASFGSFVAIQPNLKTTSVETWNFAIQHQFGSSWLASVTYLGNETDHLWGNYQANPAVLVPNTAINPANGQPYPIGSSACPAASQGCNSTTNTNVRRVLYLQNPQAAKYIGYMDQISDGGTSGYNGLLLALQKRLSQGVSINANYAWSHCIGDVSLGSGLGTAGSGYTNPNNRRFDRGNCVSNTLSGSESTDRRQIFNLTVVAQTPRFANSMERRLASGWVVSGIYRATSGPWLTVLSSTDRQLSGQNNERLTQVLSNPLVSNPGSACTGVNYTCVSWINSNAFAAPAFGTLSNMSPANIPGPGFFQLDMALSRQFRVHEGIMFEIRGEAFNITNSFRAGGLTNGTPNGLSGVTTTQSASFGQILSALDPRILQFAMKVVF